MNHKYSHELNIQFCYDENNDIFLPRNIVWFGFNYTAFLLTTNFDIVMVFLITQILLF